MEDRVDAQAADPSTMLTESPGIGLTEVESRVDQFDGRRWQLFVLFAAATTSPMMAWVNATEDPPIATYLLIVGLLFGISLGVRWLVVRLGFDRLGTTYAVSVFVFMFMNAGVLLDRGIGRTLIAFGALLVAFIVYRIRDIGMVRLIITWGAIVLVAYPPVVFLTQGESEQAILEDPDPISGQLVTDARDVLIVLVDGYANSMTLADIYALDNSSFEASLETFGFDVEPNSVSNYPRTQLSVPSLFQMNYLSVGNRLTEGDRAHLRKTLGGRNIFGEWFRSQGYRHIYMESGWYGTQCAPEVDVCIGGPWPDEALWDVAHRSLLRDLPGFETGRSFNRGANHVMAWLDSELEGYFENGEPDLIYAHLLAPHPPLFLDSRCQSHPQEGIKSFAVVEPGMPDSEIEEARDWYVSQVKCVNRVMTRVAALAAEHDAVAVIVGDHGPDSLLQLFTNDADWTEEQRRERFGVLSAVRAPGCEMSNLGSIVNVGRRLVSCMSSAEYPDLATQIFGVQRNDGEVKIVELQAPVFESER